MVRKCVACGHRKTGDQRCAMIRFPSDVDRCRKWIQLIGKSELVKMPQETMLMRYVCSCHFDEDDLKRAGPGRTVRPEAIPTILDNIVPLTDAEVAAFPGETVVAKIPQTPQIRQIFNTTRIEVPIPIAELNTMMISGRPEISNPILLEDIQTGSVGEFRLQDSEISIPTPSSPSLVQQFRDSREKDTLESATIGETFEPKTFHMFTRDTSQPPAVDMCIDENSSNADPTAAPNVRSSVVDCGRITSDDITNTLASQEGNGPQTAASNSRTGIPYYHRTESMTKRHNCQSNILHRGGNYDNEIFLSAKEYTLLKNILRGVRRVKPPLHGNMSLSITVSSY